MLEGLTTPEARKRHGIYGPNSLPVPQFTFLRLLARQARSTFNIVLLVAAIVTLALGELFDAAFIVLFIVLGVGLSLFQEYKSNAAASKLKSYLRQTVTVRRDGTYQDVTVDELVPGDLVKLQVGDIVPADAVVREADNFLVDETTFTGESVPVVKTAVIEGSGTDEQTILQGITIVRGSALAEVTATGARTRLAGIAKTSSEIRVQSQFTNNIDRISTFILRSTSIVLIFVVVANVLIEGPGDIVHLLIFAIALAVSVIPEALPLVMTFSLSSSALQLAKKDVIVKRLTSVQDLGSIDLLCSDKTGTLTENKLVYQNAYVAPNAPFHPVLLCRLAACSLNERIPEPFDRATDEAVSPDQRSELGAYELLKEEPFDPATRINSVTLKRADGSMLEIRRGSPEYFVDHGLADRGTFGEWLTKEEEHGHRVLGLSYDDGSGMRFGGLVSFSDTLKPTARATVEAAEELGIALTIITGDARLVAEAVGRDIGLVTEHAHVTEAKDFLALPASAQRERARTIRVFARTTPEQKLEIIKLLKEQYTVGYLGEGINDAPALKAANVSMVVQSASDVARETADIVLLKSDLGVIVEGVRLGREAHVNTLKYIRATMVSNFGNFYAVAVGSLFIAFLPMLPKQLLLLNLLSDVPMMAIAFDRVSKEEIKKPQQYDFRSLYVTFAVLGLVSTLFDFLYFGLFYTISPAVLQTNWFVASVITELLLLFSIRSMLPIFRAGWPAPLITGISAFAFVLAIALPFIPLTAAFFEFTPPTTTHLSIILGIALVYFIVSEIAKQGLAKFLNHREHRIDAGIKRTPA
ncbi:MAG: P-type Mg2+ transporter [Candidatus Parcubacteria bacterium]|jgi:Mg2+-importing ATPase|nr:P-type Mg2+ transporter [Candidatus Parcubacteria bacterium]